MPGKTDGWSARLTRSITLKNGTNLVTLADVRAFILKEPDHIQERASWQRAVELLIEAAETGRGIEGATERVDGRAIPRSALCAPLMALPTHHAPIGAIWLAAPSASGRPCLFSRNLHAVYRNAEHRIGVLACDMVNEFLVRFCNCS
jgi:hypothetical protein